MVRLELEAGIELGDQHLLRPAAHVLVVEQVAGLPLEQEVHVRRPGLLAEREFRLVERTGIDPSSIDDVILGAANQAGEDNRNVGRMAALLAGLPIEVPGQTVNRLCGSGLQAVVAAAHAIVAGDGDVFVAGGVESMTRAPLVMAKPSAAFPRGEQTMFDTTLGWRFTNPRLADAYYPYSMGETAENVVERCGVSREDQDAFALTSQQRWAAALPEGGLAGVAPENGDFIVAAANGSVLRIAGADGRELGRHEVDEPLASGPVLAGTDWWVSTFDGTLHRIPQLAAAQP